MSGLVHGRQVLYQGSHVPSSCDGLLWFVVKGSCVGKWVAVLGEVWALERWDLEELVRTLGTQPQKDLR